MSNVLDIDTLKLTDIVWPGTHNAGMDKKAPNHEVVFGTWTTCQNDSFAWQLANGARAFDLRLGYKQARDQAIFYFHHSGFQSHRVLDDLIEAVLAFLDRNPDEFIVLDFHQLGDDKPFNAIMLGEILLRRLGERAIPYTDVFKTVGELKQASPLRRIVMAAPSVPGMNGVYFWPRITHKWTGTRFTDTEALQRHITATLKEISSATFLWSLSATSYTFLSGPQHLKVQINDWFNTTGDWVTRCSIINTDFFDESEIVRYCWSATSMKAVYGDRLHEHR
ncbi:phospholipase [Pseudomonas sp. 14P_8.1_Bac3]|uniref:phospholipase n=1 Tax=Pseudomonas sp. 14P_8.1_Bac3 TaxID=2971621 RepID=UPI0021C847E8|nr:phospholipase [Pseudomonas sp. 14P_8.1_Bac3]MCU1759884.1 phospholipase [Pseudomonas sp. 14P_8.1_Bac3]